MPYCSAEIATRTRVIEDGSDDGARDLHHERRARRQLSVLAELEVCVPVRQRGIPLRPRWLINATDPSTNLAAWQVSGTRCCFHTD